MGKYSWLLFDADATLYDFDRAEKSALDFTLESLGIPSSPEMTECFIRHNQAVWMELERSLIDQDTLKIRRFKLFFEEAGIDRDTARASELFLEGLSRGSFLLPGAEELIQKLKGSYRMAIVTNGLREVQRRRVSGSAIHDAFEQIFVSEEISAAKPSGRFFDITFDGIGNPPKETVLMIGDSLYSDMLGGIDYGIDTCWYNPEGKPTDLKITYQIQSLPELLEIL